jgi:hypothetical protein
MNKYLYGWKFYLNYGQGWEYEIFEETFAGMKENRKAYRENCPQYPLKITRGRELNPDYRPLTQTEDSTHA